MATDRKNRQDTQATESAHPLEQSQIFGLRYLEAEAAEIHDVVGCLALNGGGGHTCTGCDDTDGGIYYA